MWFTPRSAKAFCDGQSALALSNNPTYHDRTKHIDVKFHYVREIFQKRELTLHKISTMHNPTDVMTNALASDKFEYPCDLLKLGNG